MEEQFDVFISYARRDGTALANKLAHSLRETGLRVFWDQDSIPPGVNWEAAIDKALEEAVHILVILTPFSVKSEEVTAEWRPMLSKGKNVVPLLYLPCEVPRRLSMRQYIDFHEEGRYSIALAELVAAINDFTGSEEALLELSGEELLKRGATYFDNGQLELSANDYVLALRDKDKLVRKRAAILVGKARSLKTLPAILQFLSAEQEADVKAELLDSIRKFAEATEWQAAVPTLLEEVQYYLNDSMPEVRVQAMRVLAYARYLDAVPIITRMLATDSTEYVRHQAALSLGRLKTAESTNGLLQALSDSSRGVRWAAARALGVHGNPQVIPALKILAKSDKDDEVRLAAGEAIENIQHGKG